MEVNYNGQGWGTICQNGWSISAADVVCKMLGYNSAQSFSTGSSYGPGVGRLWFDGVLCDGTESNLLGCLYNGPLVSSCDHTQEVGVSCWSELIYVWMRCMHVWYTVKTQKSHTTQISYSFWASACVQFRVYMCVLRPQTTNNMIYQSLLLVAILMNAQIHVNK